MQKLRSFAGNEAQVCCSFSRVIFSVSKQAFSRFSDSDFTTARAAPLQLAVTSRLGTPSAIDTSCSVRGSARTILNIVTFLVRCVPGGHPQIRSSHHTTG